VFGSASVIILCMTKQLWVPGKNIELHDEYPVPSSTELQNKWLGYVGEGKVIEAPGVYGAVRMPDRPPRAYASIDVCEILRETHRSMRKIEEPEPRVLSSIHRYADGLSFNNSHDVASVLQVMMTNALIEPVPDINEIAQIMKNWRERDIYVFANTSTLPGCENGTIDFFSTYLPDCLDGILLPRNHDGTLPLTKGHAARNVMEAFRGTGEQVIAVHIDDTPHHNIAFRTQVGTIPNSKVATFLPEYPTHYPVDAGSELASTPLGAFRAADAFFDQALAL